MSINLPSRRLSKSASKVLSSASTHPDQLVAGLSCLSITLNHEQRRHALWDRLSKQRSKDKIASIERDLAPSGISLRERIMKRLDSASLSKNSMFSEELAAAAPEKPEDASQSPGGADPQAGASLVREHMARATDPDPRSRVRWQRKAVIRAVTGATNAWARESRAARIKRTEREMVVRSTHLPTSVKKLVKLARQIKGKPVDDALVQMRFSTKLMSKEVANHLAYVRDRAVAERGMGLGQVNGEVVGAADDGAGVEIETKDGRYMTVTDPTRMYIDQAWVGRGPWRGFVREYRARGRINILRKPSTSISILLKEEKTRIREHEEREAKRSRQGPWVHLPNRPITAQRQYYSW